jgi:copper chaperone
MYMKKLKLAVTGMHCPSCEMLIKDSLEDMGVIVKASWKAGSVEVGYDEDKVRLDDIKKAIRKEGYDVK